MRRHTDPIAAKSLESQLMSLPQTIERVFSQEPQISEMASKYARSSRFYFTGWGGNRATAYEAALKMKEASYAITEGFQMEQLLHGPFLSSDPKTLLTLLAPLGQGYPRAREMALAFSIIGASSLALVPDGDKGLASEAADIIYMPPVSDIWSPLVYVVPLQLFTYYVSLEFGKTPTSFVATNPPTPR